MSANISSASGEPETAISIEKVPEKFFEPPAAAVTLERPPDEGENGLARSPSEAPYSIFSKDTKIFIVFMACIAGLISPLAATMYYPALNPLAEALHVSNSKITLSITTYMILQAFAPTFVATMSDNAGRRLAFMICFFIFIVADIGLALQTNYAALLILRAVQSSGCSATIALSMAVVADIATSAERGRYIGWASCGLLMGPSFGPLLGGVLAQYLGWRSIFWFLAIFAGTFLVLFAILLPETCREVVGNGSIPARGISLSLLGHMQQHRQAAKEPRREAQNHVAAAATKKRSLWPNPVAVIRILVDKESSLILLYNAILFSGQMVVSASLPSTLQRIYGYDELKVGLCYLPLGVGGLAASISQGYVTDWNFRRHARLAGLEIRKGRQQDLRRFPLERARCQITWPNHVVTIAAMFGYGWAVRARSSIAGPEAVLFILGFSTMGAFNVSNAFLIDLHRDSPATATAAVNLTRCLISAGGVAVIVPMINAMGEGWAFSIIAFIYVAMLPVLWVIMKWGPGWRIEKLEKEDRKLEEQRRNDEKRQVEVKPEEPQNDKLSTISKEEALEA